MTKTVNIKNNGNGLTLADPRAEPGDKSPSGAIIISVIGCPDDMPMYDVMRQLQKVVVLPLYPTFTVPWSTIAGKKQGSIVKLPPLDGISA